VVDRLKQEYSKRIQVAWKAFELRPEPAPLPQPATPARLQRWETSVLPMAAERGLLMKVPPVSPRTRLTFQAVELAREHGKFDAMHRAVFEAFFCAGLDIGNAEVLADLAGSIDLDPALMKPALEAGTYLNHVLEQEELARKLGVTGVPAMFVGDDLGAAEPVIGAVPYDWMKATVDRALLGDSLEWRRRSLRSSIPLKTDE
jgi:predicted DsbA family dithiol-disulfide isomerase